MSEVRCTVCEKPFDEAVIEVNGYRMVEKGVLLPYAICKQCLSIMDGQVVNYQKSQEKRQSMLASIDAKLRSVHQKKKAQKKTTKSAMATKEDMAEAVG